MSSSAPAMKPLSPFEQSMLELVNRGGDLDPYTRIPAGKIPKLKLQADMIAYASPDSTYAVTKRLLDAAKKKILIGIYDFTAPHMKQLVLDAMSRGVKVALMLDIDSDGERTLFNDLKKRGCDAIVSPSKASKHLQIFRSSHEKVIVIDDEWTLVQSGNYSVNSVPLNEKDGGDPNSFRTGNRDMGLAVRSAELAKFFTFVLRRDMEMEKKAEESEAVERPIPPPGIGELLIEAPTEVPKRFASKAFPKNATAVPVTPVISPENYMTEVPELLGSAKKYVLLEQQYIKSNQDLIQELLKAIPQDVEVRIILAKPLGSAAQAAKEYDGMRALSKFGYKFGRNIRLLNPKLFAHCHNKLIVVDGKQVLISSQNWSNAAVSENREAGLIVSNPKITAYFETIFESDWESGLTAPPKPKAKPEIAGLEALNSGRRLLPISLADYVEV